MHAFASSQSPADAQGTQPEVLAWVHTPLVQSSTVHALPSPQVEAEVQVTQPEMAACAQAPPVQVSVVQGF